VVIQTLDLSALPAGRALRVRRVALDLKATDVARLVGCDTATLWAVERDKVAWPHEVATRERLGALYARLEAEAPGAA
jgi:hypothetical protein